MRRSLSAFHLPALAAALCCALPVAPALAEVSFNVGGVSDYRFRGVSQTRTRPALQGGADYSHASGFYVGTWASTIEWISDLGGDADVEVDLYGGFKGSIVEGLGYDVGVLRYQYPSNRLNPSANTTEVYGALSYGPATLKYSHAVTDTFGNADSKNSFYVDASASFELPWMGLMLAPHVGYQKIKGPSSDPASYTDYSLTLSKDFSGLVVSLAVVGTDADKGFYSSPVNGRRLARTTGVVGVKYAF